MKIRLFNDFTIEYNEKKMSMQELLPKQTLSLLQILIIRHGNVVNKSTLIRLLWDDVSNPASSLKFNIHRLRKLLEEIDEFKGLDLVSTQKGGYQFNPEIDCEIDCEEFEEISQILKKQGEINDENVDIAQKLCDIYQGPLLNQAYIMWVDQKSVYFSNVYTEVVNQLCAYYLSHGFNEKLKANALKATTINPSIEENHFYYIRALISENRYSEAYEYYQKICKMLISDYELSLSEKMKGLYDDIVQNNEQTENINGITNYFQNKTFGSGAYFCEDTSFDDIYEIRMRSAKREGQEYFLVMFEIHNEEDEKHLLAYQDKLKMSIGNTLRSGDVFTKLNKYQYLLLLTCPNEDIVYKVVQRVNRNFRQKTKGKNVRLNYYVQDVRNIEQNITDMKK